MDEETEVDLMKEDICAWVFQRRCHISLHQQQFVYHLTDWVIADWQFVCVWVSI